MTGLERVELVIEIAYDGELALWFDGHLTRAEVRRVSDSMRRMAEAFRGLGVSMSEATLKMAALSRALRG